MSKSSTSAETLALASGLTVTVLLTGEDTGGAVAAFEDIAAPGVGPPRHIHHLQDETFLFLEGQFDVEIDGVLHHFGTGDMAFVPKGTVHAFKNAGETTARVRYIFTPALKMEEMFRAVAADFRSGGLDEGAAATAAEHGLEIVGPPL